MATHAEHKITIQRHNHPPHVLITKQTQNIKHQGTK